jgi:dCMP deaminase
MMKMNKWNKRFMDLAKMAATWSKDKSTGVGAVIVNDRKKVLSLGFNGFPRGVDDDIDSRHERPKKNHYVVHAERNALDEAETSLEGATIYCTFFTCATCAHGIIQKGLKRVVAPEPDWDAERYADSQKAALEMYLEAGVEVEYYDIKSDKPNWVFWEIGCGGGKVHAVVSHNNFKKYVDYHVDQMKRQGIDVKMWTINKEFDIINIVIGKSEKENKYLHFAKYETNEFIFNR